MNLNRRLLSARPVAIDVAMSFLFLVCVVSAGAQTSRIGATLQGTVTDSSGAVIPDVKVILRNTLTNQGRTVATDERGFFRAEALVVGTYEVRVEQAGFAAYRHAGVQVGLGQTIFFDIVLVPASASVEVTVSAQPSTIDTSQTSVVSSIDQERIEELPVRNRNYLDFVLLSPGVSSAPAASGAAATPLAGSGFTFGGLRTRSNNVSIDGLDNNDEYTGSSRTELSPEIVQEFQVVNNGLSAESGAASGGPLVRDRTFYYAAAEQEHNRGQAGSDIDPTVVSSINTFLVSGAFPGVATRHLATGLFPIARAETEVAGKLDHQLTKNTALMLRYVFTNNKESGDVFNNNGLVDASARGSSFTSDNALSASLTSVLGSDAVSDFRFQAATRHAVLRTTDPFGPGIDIAGLIAFGRPYAGNSVRRENHYQAGYTYTRTLGKHLWKVGGTVNRVRLRADVPDGFGSVD